MKFSIITVNLNNAKGLQKTIDSVVNQTFTDYEYIIIDGGSTDGSVDVINAYADKISYWTSGPDKGIYNAMNKGIDLAKGEYCQFLNSGDWLIDSNVLRDLSLSVKNVDIVYGNVLTHKGLIEYPEILTFKFFFKATLCHQAVFHKTELFRKHGLYKEDLSIVADWEFLLNTLIRHHASFQNIHKTICFYDFNGMSSNPDFAHILFSQRDKVLKELFPMMYDDYVELFNLKKQMKQYQFYDNSKLVQLVKNLQTSRLYKKLRKVN